LSFSDDRTNIVIAPLLAQTEMITMTAQSRTTAKNAKPAAKRAAKTRVARKAAAKVQAAPVAAVKAKGGAKTPSPKIAAALALAQRPQGASLTEVANSQDWNVRASERHLRGWAASYGFTLRREVADGHVAFHMKPIAA
jgi:hypothetical protein